MNKVPYCWMLVGLPSVGKTTYIENEMRGRDIDFAHLSSDMYIENYAAARGKTYNEVFSECVEDASRMFFDDIRNYTKINQNVVIDRTNLTVSSRRKILNMIPSHYKKIAIIFECPKFLHDERLASRPGKIIPSYVLEKMNAAYVTPTLDEGFDSISIVQCENFI